MYQQNDAQADSSPSKKREFSWTETKDDENNKRVVDGRNDLTITIPTHVVQVGNGPTAMKILVPPSLCGPLIGKGGSVINEMSKATNARIRISGNTSVYPGTTDRVAIISGNGEAVVQAIEVFLNKLFQTEKESSESSANPSPSSEIRARVLIPFPAAGMVIGRGGDHIRQIRQLYNCRMKVGENEDRYGTRERIVSLAAEQAENVIKGVRQISLLLLKDPAVGSYSSLECQYGMVGMMSGPPMAQAAPMNPQYSAYGGAHMYAPQMDQGQMAYSAYQTSSAPPQTQSNSSRSNTLAYPYAGAATRPQEQSYQPSEVSSLDITFPVYQTDGVSITMTLGVPEQKVGVLMGKGAAVLKEIRATTGATMHISQKDDLIPGTNHRKVVVTGNQAQVQSAHGVIMQRLLMDAANPRQGMY